MGAGSAMPVVSITTLSNQRSPPRAYRPGACARVRARSLRIVQQMHPLSMATRVSSSMRVSR